MFFLGREFFNLVSGTVFEIDMFCMKFALKSLLADSETITTAVVFLL